MQNNIQKCACGVDEVGRGALAGPIVVASVVFKNYQNIPKNIKDSKQTTSSQRKKILKLILESSHVGIGYIHSNIIDLVGISKATEIAANESILKNQGNKNLVLIDGNIKISSKLKKKNIIKGDCNYVSTAAASIVAKSIRDNIMTLKSFKYPIYKWHKNKGYGTKDHLLAIKLYGITEIHRKSFNMNGKKIDYA